MHLSVVTVITDDDTRRLGGGGGGATHLPHSSGANSSASTKSTFTSFAFPMLCKAQKHSAASRKGNCLLQAGPP